MAATPMSGAPGREVAGGIRACDAMAVLSAGTPGSISCSRKACSALTLHAPGQGADTGRSAQYDPHGQRGADASFGLIHRCITVPRTITGQDA